MDKLDARCDNLIRTTMDVLDPATVALMLLAVRVQNLELNIQYVVRRWGNKLELKQWLTQREGY
jgi:hypothetical protein